MEEVKEGPITTNNKKSQWKSSSQITSDDFVTEEMQIDTSSKPKKQKDIFSIDEDDE